MTEPINEDRAPYTSSDLTFNELVERKAANHERMDAVRASWRSNTAAMTECERREASQRFSNAIEKIASQFGRSRRMALDVPTDGHIELTEDATRGVCEVGKDLHEPKTRDV
jgi:hypothetical protein